jgi:hypothetical protein
LKAVKDNEGVHYVNDFETRKNFGIHIALFADNHFSGIQDGAVIIFEHF